MKGPLPVLLILCVCGAGCDHYTSVHGVVWNVTGEPLSDVIVQRAKESGTGRAGRRVTMDERGPVTGLRILTPNVDQRLAAIVRKDRSCVVRPAFKENRFVPGEILISHSIEIR